jgi:hypothetical protein
MRARPASHHGRSPPSRPPVLLAAAAAAAIAGLPWACTPDFDNITTIKDLRLLAIAATPAEVLVDPATLTSADRATIEAQLPEFTVSALVVDPAGAGRAVSYQVEACGNDPLEGNADPSGRPGRVGATVAQAPCPTGSTRVAEGSALPAADGTVVLPIAFTPSFDLLAAAVRADPLGIELGLPLKLSFVIRAGAEEVVAVKRVLLSPRLSPDQQPNANPVIDALLWRPDRDAAAMPLDPAVPLPLRRGTRLRIGPTPGDAEPYEARSYSREQRRFVTEAVSAETLRYAFFATAGTLGPGNTSTEPSLLRTNAQVDLESVYSAPSEGPRLVDIFVIVRDERTGASWARARLQIE